LYHAPHNITLDDLSSLKTLGIIALSPNGRRVAFELYTTDREQDETRCTLWLLLLDEDGNALGEPRQLTRGKKSAGNPVWAPDSQRLLFLSTREDDKPQLWLLDTDGGEASCLTHVLGTYARVGMQIYVSTLVPRPCGCIVNTITT
jgi:dipeptidyl aminopeptidase/acylaminoacyl peptidase